MLPKDLAWVRGKLRFVNAGDEALYQATRFTSQFTFDVGFALFCMVQQLGVLAHAVVSAPSAAERPVVNVTIPLLAAAASTLGVRVALHHLLPPRLGGWAAHIYFGTQCVSTAVVVAQSQSMSR